MNVDTKMSLRTSLCLANPSAMQGARWEKAGFRGACAVPPESERYARGGRAWTPKGRKCSIFLLASTNSISIKQAARRGVVAPSSGYKGWDGVDVHIGYVARNGTPPS